MDSQKDISLKIYKTTTTEDFRANQISDQYVNGNKLTVKLPTTFDIYETLFLKITFLKTKYCIRLSDPHLNYTLCMFSANIIFYKSGSMQKM